MVKSKGHVICSVVVIVIIISAGMSHGQDSKFGYRIGEEFTYKVKYSFLRLGTLRLVVNDSVKINGHNVYHTQLFIDSNPLLFFVNMHNVYNSYIDDEFRLQLFKAEERIDDILYTTEYRFSYEDSMIYATLTNIKDPNQIIRKEITMDELLLDGSSLIFYARANVHSVKAESLATFFEAKKGRVFINFKGKQGQQAIDAIGKGIDTYYVDGMMNSVGIAGLNGPFKGWFAVDSQRPPIRAKLKVFIGHVTVELEEWKNWDYSKNLQK